MRAYLANEEGEEEFNELIIEKRKRVRQIVWGFRTLRGNSFIDVSPIHAHTRQAIGALRTARGHNARMAAPERNVTLKRTMLSQWTNNAARTSKHTGLMIQLVTYIYTFQLVRRERGHVSERGVIQQRVSPQLCVFLLFVCC